MTIGTKQHQVLDLSVTAFLRSVNDVLKIRLALAEHFQANCEWFSRSCALIRFFLRQIAIRIAPQISLSLRPLGDVLLDVFVVALFFRREVAICLALLDELVGGGSVLWRIRRLKNEVFVVIKSEPLETFDDRACRLVRRA